MVTRWSSWSPSIFSVLNCIAYSDAYSDTLCSMLVAEIYMRHDGHTDSLCGHLIPAALQRTHPREQYPEGEHAAQLFGPGGQYQVLSGMQHLAQGA